MLNTPCSSSPSLLPLQDLSNCCRSSEQSSGQGTEPKMLSPPLSPLQAPSLSSYQQQEHHTPHSCCCAATQLHLCRAQEPGGFLLGWFFHGFFSPFFPPSSVPQQDSGQNFPWRKCGEAALEAPAKPGWLLPT